MQFFRRILVPHDGSEPATRALKLAAELAHGRGRRLLVLQAVPPYFVAGVPPAEGAAWVPSPEFIAGERRRLETLTARAVGGRNAPAVECRVEIGDPFERIMQAARDVDSVVMATAGRTGLAHLLIGSVAEKVVRHAPVPVLTIRPAAVRRRRSATRPRRRKASGARGRKAARAARRTRAAQG